jgi:hypothetical protein
MLMKQQQHCDARTTNHCSPFLYIYTYTRTALYTQSNIRVAPTEILIFMKRRRIYIIPLQIFCSCCWVLMDQDAADRLLYYTAALLGKYGVHFGAQRCR